MSSEQTPVALSAPAGRPPASKLYQKIIIVAVGGSAAFVRIHYGSDASAIVGMLLIGGLVAFVARLFVLNLAPLIWRKYRRQLRASRGWSA